LFYDCTQQSKLFVPNTLATVFGVLPYPNQNANRGDQCCKKYGNELNVIANVGSNAKRFENLKAQVEGRIIAIRDIIPYWCVLDCKRKTCRLKRSGTNCVCEAKHEAKQTNYINPLGRPPVSKQSASQQHAYTQRATVTMGP